MERAFLEVPCWAADLDLARSSKRPLFVAKTDGDSDNIADDDMLRKLMIPTDFSKKSLVALNLIRSLREHVAEVVFVFRLPRTKIYYIFD